MTFQRPLLKPLLRFAAPWTVMLSLLPSPLSAAPGHRKLPIKAPATHGKKKAASQREPAAKAARHAAPANPAVRQSATARVEQSLAASAVSALAYPDALNAFFDALAAEQQERSAEASPATPSHTVRVLQFGDSHTAADYFTGELRARIQQQFGDGGLGFQYPGHPFPGYHLAGSGRSQSSGWRTEGNRFTDLGDGNLGLGGLSIATSLAGQTITLQTTCDTLQLHFLRQPGGGRLQFTDNDTPIATVETASDAASATNDPAGTFSYACTPGTHDLHFTTLDYAPVKLFGLVTEQSGATWECLGLNGAVAPLMLRWNQPLFTTYLAQRDPALIVLAYGTNEAGSSAGHLATYPADFVRLLDTLHSTVPKASILVLGPADRAVAAGRGRHRSWQPLTGTSRIIAMQKEACQTHGCAFWDTRYRMGGLGAMPLWVAAGLGQPDRTHLTGVGYRTLADALYTDLTHAYNLYQHPEGTAATRPSPSPRT